jgi:hypothetical protein
MSEPTETRQGRCLCRQTRYVVAGPVRWTCHCHCESCRRQTGSPYTTFIGVARTDASFIGAAPGIYRSSPGVERLFCAACGTPIAFRADKYPDEIHFYAVTLEDPERVTPECHVHWEERLPWVVCDDDLPKHEGSYQE